MDESVPIFDFGAIWTSRSILLEGFGIAMFCATAAIILAMAIGLVIALMRLSSNRFVRGFAFTYTQLFRGVPLYVLLIWVYFGLAIVANINLPKIPAGILTLALLNSGYLSETFRSGILAVNIGQSEAGAAIGLTNWQIKRYIVIPQAFRIVLAPSGNQYVDAIKDTAILSIIGVPELMRLAQQQADLFYRPFEFYTVAGVLYFIAVMGVTKLFSYLEKRLSRTMKQENELITTKLVVSQIH
jgi:His/Glu/Gln/Arg/opine family amino acid ABC transporter permease subunit